MLAFVATFAPSSEMSCELVMFRWTREWSPVAVKKTDFESESFRSWPTSVVILYVKVNVLVAQLYSTVCKLMDCILPGSSVHGIFQATTLDWVAIPFSRGSS